MHVAGPASYPITAILRPTSNEPFFKMPGNDSGQSHLQRTVSGPALTVVSFNVEGLSAAKQQLIADLSSKHQWCNLRAGDPPLAKRHPAQRTMNGFSHRETPRAIWQCHICDVRHHRQRNIANLSEVGLQTTR